MFLFQILNGEFVSQRIIYIFFNIFVFLYFVFYSKINRLENIGFAVKIMTFLGSISVLMITKGDTTIIWRNQSLIDKGFLTIFFAISLCLCITDIIFKKNIYINIFLFLFYFYLNMFFIQSKTAFVSLGLYLCIIFFLVKGRYRLYFLLVLAIGCMIILANSNTLLSGSMANAVNVFFQNDIFSLDASVAKKNMGTFEARELITAYCLILFLKSPLWGIGIGKYSEMGGFMGITECESTYLDMLVEGGLLFFIPVFANIVIPLIYGIYRLKRGRVVSYVSVLSCIVVCFYWNDFLHPFVFALIGICCYAIFSYNINIADKKNNILKLQ